MPFLGFYFGTETTFYLETIQAQWYIPFFINLPAMPSYPSVLTGKINFLTKLFLFCFFNTLLLDKKQKQALWHV